MRRAYPSSSSSSAGAASAASSSSAAPDDVAKRKKSRAADWHKALERQRQFAGDDEDDEDEDPFRPPPRPESSGVQRTDQTLASASSTAAAASAAATTTTTDPSEPLKPPAPVEAFTLTAPPQEQYRDGEGVRTSTHVPAPVWPKESPLELRAYQQLYPDAQAVDSYYQRVNVRTTPHRHPPSSSTPVVPMSASADDTDVHRKLNYMIHLLEEQRDERTHHVAEEVVMYSFLGVFVIFVVDTFARAGKYVR